MADSASSWLRKLCVEPCRFLLNCKAGAGSSRKLTELALRDKEGVTVTDGILTLSIVELVGSWDTSKLIIFARAASCPRKSS